MTNSVARRFGQPWLLLLAAACGAGERQAPLLVFASTSLAEPFRALVAAHQLAHPELRIELDAASTPQLVERLRGGAAADVFAAVDATSIAEVVAAGRALGIPRTFARNRLAIVVGSGNPQGITGLADLGRDGLRVALCGPDVPAGRLARQALLDAGIAVRPVADAPDGEAIVGKVRSGEIDAGIVFASDARAGGVAVLPLPAEHDVRVEHALTRIRTGRAAAAGEVFVAFVLSPAGQRILAEQGLERL